MSLLVQALTSWPTLSILRLPGYWLYPVSPQLYCKLCYWYILHISISYISPRVLGFPCGVDPVSGYDVFSDVIHWPKPGIALGPRVQLLNPCTLFKLNNFPGYWFSPTKVPCLGLWLYSDVTHWPEPVAATLGARGRADLPPADHSTGGIKTTLRTL